MMRHIRARRRRQRHNAVLSAVPILPSSDLNRTESFCTALGFTIGSRDTGYLALHHGRAAFALVCASYCFGMTATFPMKEVCIKPGMVQDHQGAMMRPGLNPERELEQTRPGPLLLSLTARVQCATARTRRTRGETLARWPTAC
jgi:hypothetical protein